MSVDLALNRRLMAERRGWPGGVLDTCERLDREHPGWSVWWQMESTVPGFEHPAGFLADWLADDSVVVCAETEAGIVAAMQAAPARVTEPGMRERCCARRWR